MKTNQSVTRYKHHFPCPVSRVPRPVSRVPRPVSCVPRPVSCVPRPVSRVPRPVSCVPRPVSRVPRHALLFLILLLFSSSSFSQDRKPPNPTILPFQQNAPQSVTDEQLARQLYQNREFEKAAEVYERLYEQNQAYQYYQYLLFCLVEIKEYGKAERVIKKCQRTEPEALKYQVDLGYIYNRAGNPEKARKLFEDALKKLSPNQQQIFELANAFLSRGESEYAVRTYQKGRQLINDAYAYGFELAALYERMGDFENSMTEYLNLLQGNKSQMNTVQDRIQMTLAFDVNNEKHEIFRKILLTRAQKNPDETYYTEMLWWYSIQQKDFELAFIQAKALDRRLKENGDKLISLASLAISNEQYDVAIECYQYLISKGTAFPHYDYSRRELANTRYLKIISEPAPLAQLLESLEKELHGEIINAGADPASISLIRNLAHLKAFYIGKPDEAIDLLEQAIEMTGVTAADRAKCKIELADVLLFTGDVWEATLLYQQAYQDFKFDVLGQEAKFKNAKLSFYIGEFKWAKAQADILKAATSKFISNDAIALSLLISENYDPDSNTIALGIYARADLLNYRNQADLAIATLDSITQLFTVHPILQQVLFKKGEIKSKQGKYAEADSLFLLLAKEYSGEMLADEALMHAADLNEKQLKNFEKAMALYQELLDQYPGSIYVPEARKQFRMLRGDKIQ